MPLPLPVLQSYDVDPAERVQIIRGILERAGSGKASMLQDVEAGSRTKIDVIKRGRRQSCTSPRGTRSAEFRHGCARKGLRARTRLNRLIWVKLEAVV
jgi:hypothetical protein